MIKAIALDDEPLALEVVQFFCSQNDLIELVACFQKISEAKTFLASNEVELIFLDIEMPSKNGMEFYKQLSNPPLVIFTTAYSDYALEGFNVSAIDYLLKPFTKERFHTAIAKAAITIGKHTSIATEHSILVKSDSKLIKVNLNDIHYIEALDNYIKIVMLSNKIIVARNTMKSIAQQLPNQFMRIHKSYIIPISKITATDSKQVFLQNTAIPIGDIYKKELLAKLME